MSRARFPARSGLAGQEASAPRLGLAPRSEQEGYGPALDVLEVAGQGAALSRRRRQETAAGAAVADLFERHGRMVYGICRMLLGSREEAEDAAQQTFLSAHRTLLRGGSVREPAAWLATIARNECRRRYGRRRVDIVPLHDTEPSGGAGPDGIAIAREELEALGRALTKLPSAQRQAIVLREFYGLSYEEVAAALGRSGRAVESLLFKSRRTLNAQLQPLRDAAGALILPATLRDSLANLITGFSNSSGTAAAGAGGVAAAKIVGLPAGAKIAAVLAAGAAATGLAAEGVFNGSSGGRRAEPARAHPRTVTAGQPEHSENRPPASSAPIVFSATTETATTTTRRGSRITHPRRNEREHPQSESEQRTSSAVATSEHESATASEGGDSSTSAHQSGEREQTRTTSEKPKSQTTGTETGTTETQTTETQTTETQTRERQDGQTSGDSGGDGSAGPSSED